MMPPIKEPDLALAGVALLVMFGLLMWYDSPIKNSHPLDPYLKPPKPLVTGDAYESWLWQDPFEFKKPYLKPKKGDQCKDQLIHLKNGVKILAPVLKVAPDALGNKELRIRYRYAVIAGLIESGYRPSEPDHLHFCSAQSSNKEYNVRWERYSHESKKDGPGKNEPGKDKPDKDKAENNPDVIVVWMNSEVEIFSSDNRFTLAPELLSNKKNELHIFDLYNILDSAPSEKIKGIKNITFSRLADTDLKTLTKNLTKELVERRNIKEPSEVEIITEHDSHHIRKLASTFCESFPDSFGKGKQPVTEAKPDTCEIRGIKNVFYLKGVDGNQLIIDEQNKNEDYQAASKQADHRSVMDLHNPKPLPLAEGQVDYLHRLAKEIKDSHNDIDTKKRDSGIKAVGIFGSDFNDKLRILETLRLEMPEILVFTTDLDAQMFSGQHWRATRNLVVASHFNLRVGNEYQGHFPDFRDSQQTAIFYHTIKIFGSDVKPPEPQIFEIGRHGPVRLVQEKNEESSIHTQNEATQQLKLLSGLGGITLALILFLWQALPNSRYLINWLGIGSVIIFFAWFFAVNDSRGEPLSFTDGTSLWPTAFIQISATLLACAFIFYAKRILESNSDALANRYELQAGSNNRVNRGLAGWVCIIFLSTFASYAWNDVDPTNHQFTTCLLFLSVLAFAYILIFELDKENFRSIKHWAEKDNRNIVGLDDLWQQYCDHGQFHHRASRVVAIWLFFAIIETILIYLLPPWPSPCRGDTCDWFSWIGVISFVVVMILLFFILDAVRLSYFWIKKLRTNHPLLADKTTLTSQDSQDVDGIKRSTTALRSLEEIVDLVAERTLVVDKLIYFPMLCIMLLLFARIAYFDNQEFPLSKGITFAASISLLFYAGFMLRKEAEELRLCVIKSAENLVKDKIILKKTEVDAVINKIKNINKGAFEPMFEQPVMRASLIILASIGIFAAKYLKIFE
jgi:hypothetical protein